MDLRLGGKVVMITGASRGLGRACAMALAQAGETDRALGKLESALSGGYRDVADLQTSPYFESLRRDPRFAALLAKHGLTRTHPAP